MQVRYQVAFTKSAQKEFARLPLSMRERILEAVTILAQNPFTELLQIKKLKGADDLYRIRLGNYRVVYEIRKTILLIVVIKIGHRKEVYR